MHRKKNNPQYICQHDDYSCSPVCLYNVGQWLGDAVSLKFLTTLCHTDVDGTEDKYFNKTLRSTWNNLHVVKKRAWNNSTIFHHFENGGAVVIAHLDTDNEWHHSFWTGYRQGINTLCQEFYIYDVLQRTVDAGATPDVYFLTDLSKDRQAIRLKQKDRWIV